VKFCRLDSGTLDIHQINTGRGNSTFFVFPDGTTMLLDAGSGAPPPPRGTAPRPDASRGAWRMDRSLRAAHARTRASPHIDYGYITHFHSDHLGSVSLNRSHLLRCVQAQWADRSRGSHSDREDDRPGLAELRLSCTACGPAMQNYARF
jgi:glyoxylase-like metal-dependent hydrolase (beta-lactamase superfamily II)